MTSTMSLRSRVLGNWQARFWRAAALVRESLTLIINVERTEELTGTMVKKSLSVRTHVCPCGAVLARDHNAALNILAKALRQVGIEINTVGHTGIDAWGQNELYLLVVTSTRKSTD